MTTPRVGAQVADQHAATCTYAPHPGDPRCTHIAAWHLAVEVDDGVFQVAACTCHSSIAKAAGRLVHSHPFRGLCALPGTVWLWRANFCAFGSPGPQTPSETPGRWQP